MIKWNRTAMVLPEPGKELVAKDPLKPSSYRSAIKQCRVMKFHPDFTANQIQSAMIECGENLTLWAYTEGTCDE